MLIIVCIFHTLMFWRMHASMDMSNTYQIPGKSGTIRSDSFVLKSPFRSDKISGQMTN